MFIISHWGNANQNRNEISFHIRIQKKENDKGWGGFGEAGTLLHGSGDVKWFSPCGNQLQSHKGKQRTITPRSILEGTEN